MKKLIITTTALLALVSIALVGCSDSTSDGSTGLAERIVDTVAVTVASNVIDSQKSEPAPIPASTAEFRTDGSIGMVRDIIVVDSVIYALHADGIAMFDLRDETETILVSDVELNAIARHGVDIYVGGDKLYLLVEFGLEEVEGMHSGVVRSLDGRDDQLVIGTDNGLYIFSPFGNRILMEGVQVSSVVQDNDGVWFGTVGSGLYRWDGTNIRQRYLIRDTTLFDFVNCLDYRRGHLYVGTDDGLYIYDGGIWQTFTIENGLPSNAILDIDATYWVVYVATADGLVGYFNDCFDPVTLTDRLKVSSICYWQKNLFVGTEQSGLFKKSGPAMIPLVVPQADTTELFSSLTL
jgi:hypothetical protein